MYRFPRPDIIDQNTQALTPFEKEGNHSSGAIKPSVVDELQVRCLVVVCVTGTLIHYDWPNIELRDLRLRQSRLLRNLFLALPPSAQSRRCDRLIGDLPRWRVATKWAKHRISI